MQRTTRHSRPRSQRTTMRKSAVERELVLRLASLLWRLRRATTMETGLFEIQADHLREVRQVRQRPSSSSVRRMFAGAIGPSPDVGSHGAADELPTAPGPDPQDGDLGM